MLLNKTGNDVYSDCKHIHILLRQGWWGCASLNTEQGQHTPSIHNGTKMEYKYILGLLLDIHVIQRFTFGTVVLLYLAEISRQMDPIFIHSMITEHRIKLF